jgi:hypothetical protein
MAGEPNASGGSNSTSSDPTAGSAGSNGLAQGGSGGDGQLIPGAGAGGTAASCDPATLDPGPSPLLRLTPIQYRNTIQELFGSLIDTTQLFPNEIARAHIGLLQPDVSQFDVETYQGYAELVAAAVASNATQLAPCDAPTVEASASACMQTFISTFGPRIYRSPLTTADVDRVLAVFNQGFQGAGYAHGLELAVSAMLQSPRFLYRPELGDATAQGATATAVPLSGYEIASRLAYAFWNSAPDAELLTAASDGSLSTPAGRDAQLVRLVADPRAHESFRNFLYAWLGLSDLDTVVKDRTAFPTWQDDTPAELKKQADAFFDEVLFGQAGGTLSSMFSLPLGQFAPPTLSDWQQDAATATGVLTLPALLAVHSKATESFPIYRGLLVREQLLCQPLPPPPPAAAANPPQPMPGIPTRERFEQHSVDPACTGCHRLMDPIGFAFENYDAIGRYRTEDRGLAIDPSGALNGTDVDGPFTGVAELSSILDQSEQVRSCTARQWFRYVMQRFDQASDACSTGPVIDAFTTSGYRWESLQTSVIHTPAFLQRRPIVPGDVTAVPAGGATP